MLSPHDPTYKEYLAQVGLKSLGYNPGTPDNWWGNKTEEAYQAFLHAGTGLSVYVDAIASTFADPADVAAFKRCKSQGKSDQECFRVGDNAIGFWGDATDGTIAMVALPPETILKRHQSLATARLSPVMVQYSGKSVRALLGDTMPHLANITNGAGIDLNPACAAAIGIPKGGMVHVAWSWA